MLYSGRSTPERSIGKRLIYSLLKIVVGVFGGFCLLAFLFQSRLVYFPHPHVENTPAELGLEYEEVWLQTSDGVKLSAWFVPAPQARAVLLHCHGNAGNISHRLPYLAIFHRLGVQTFLFDYRGYGNSEGEPSEKGTYLDAEAAWRFLVEQRGFQPSQIILHGQSLGGAVAAWLASRHQPAALILESAFTSLADIGAVHYPLLPVRLLSRFDYNTRESLRQAHAPVLVIHSRQDEIIPFSHGLRLLESAPEPKEFLEITGDHNAGFLTSGSVYEEGLRQFFTKHLPAPDPPSEPRP